MRNTELTRQLLLPALIAYALVFVALSIDIIVRIWDWRWKFESPLDVVALIFFEGIRSTVTLAGIGATVLCAHRARRHPALLSLALATIFATIAYTKVIAFRGFPGALQERLATALLAADVPGWALRVVFGQPAWAAWLALGAVLLFTHRYPRLLQADEVRASGARDRAGAMRSVALAGTDVGALGRALTGQVLERGWLRPQRVWPLAGTVTVAYTVLALSLGGSSLLALHATAALVAAAGITLVVTLARTAWVLEPTRRQVPMWLRRGLLAALVLVACSAVATALGFTVAAVALLSLAPAAVVTGVIAAALSAPAAEADAASVAEGDNRAAPGSAGVMAISDPVGDE
jgi:hypothetical protein